MTSTFMSNFEDDIGIDLKSEKDIPPLDTLNNLDSVLSINEIRSKRPKKKIKKTHNLKLVKKKREIKFETEEDIDKIFHPHKDIEIDKEFLSLQNRFFEYLLKGSFEECKQLFLSSKKCRFWKFRDKENYTPIHHSVYMNNYLVTYELIKIASEHISKEKVSELLNTQSSKGFVPIHYAAYNGNIKMIILLLSKGADYRIKNNSGLNVMHLAAQGNQINPIYFFMYKYGMAVQCVDYSCSSTLHWACFHNNEKVIKFLLKYNLNDVNFQNNDNLTPLHIAVSNNNFQATCDLLSCNADVRLKNNQNVTPLGISKINGYSDITKLLKRADKMYFYNKIFNYIKNNEHPIFIKRSFYISQFIFPFFIFLFNMPFISGIIFSCVYFLLNLINVILIFLFSKIPTGYLEQTNEKVNIFEMVLDEGSLVDINQYCIICEIKINEDSYHCLQCNKCIANYFCHFYLGNKCIGKENSFIFKIMILYLNILYIVNIITSCYTFYFTFMFRGKSLEIYFNNKFKGIYKIYNIGRPFICIDIFSFLTFVSNIILLLLTFPYTVMILQRKLNQEPKISKKVKVLIKDENSINTTSNEIENIKDKKDKGISNIFSYITLSNEELSSPKTTENA